MVYKQYLTAILLNKKKSPFLALFSLLIGFSILFLFSINLPFCYRGGIYNDFLGAGNLLFAITPRANTLSNACCGVAAAIRARIWFPF